MSMRRVLTAFPLCWDYFHTGNNLPELELSFLNQFHANEGWNRPPENLPAPDHCTNAQPAVCCIGYAKGWLTTFTDPFRLGTKPCAQSTQARLRSYTYAITPLSRLLVWYCFFVFSMPAFRRSARHYEMTCEIPPWHICLSFVFPWGWIPRTRACVPLNVTDLTLESRIRVFV
jgi:hypothetical protein